MTVGLDMCIFAILLYVSKTSTYSMLANIFFELDYKLFIRMSSIRINYFLIFRMLNVGIALFLISIPLFMFRYKNPSLRPVKIKTLVLGILGLIVPVFYVIYSDPYTSYIFYLIIYGNSPGYKQYLTALLTVLDGLNYIWIVGYLVFPVICLGNSYSEIRAVYFKRRNLTFLVCFIVMNTFFFAVFFTGPFKELYIYSSNLDTSLVKHIVGMEIPVAYYNLLPLVMLVSLTVIVVMLQKNKGLETVDILKRVFVEKNIRQLNGYFRGFLHGFKNSIFNIKILAEKAEEEMAGQPADSVRKINMIATETIADIGRILDSLRDMNIKPKRNNLCDCIDEALSSVHMNDNIAVEKKYDEYDRTFAYFDFYLFKTAFVNILQNAVEAIELKGEQNGRIVIDVSCESMLIAVSITDNGIGIKRGQKRKIFNMFYTTKARQKNWGAGLAYVATVVRKHLGIINVYSRYGKCTQFEIIVSKARDDARAIQYTQGACELPAGS